jgi:hypothetical protein
MTIAVQARGHLEAERYRFVWFPTLTAFLPHRAPDMGYSRLWAVIRHMNVLPNRDVWPSNR